MRSRPHMIVRGLAGVVGASLVLSFSPVILAEAQTDEASLLRELTLRALGDGPSAKVTLSPGRLPDVQPPLAVPAGWRVIGSLTRTYFSPTGAVNTQTNAFLDGTGSASDALAALTTALAATGWRAMTNTPNASPSGGFVSPTATSAAHLFVCGGDNSFANVTALSGPTTDPVRVSINISAVPGGGSTPCSAGSALVPATTLPPFASVYTSMPRLTLPATAVVVAGGGLSGGSRNGATSAVTVDKAPSPVDMERDFAAQMQAAGWRRLGGASDAALAASVWRKTVNDTELQAVLSVANALGGDQRRDLSLVVTAPATSSGPGFAGPPTIAPMPILVGPPVLVGPPATVRVAAAVASGGPATVAPAPLATAQAATGTVPAGPGFQAAETGTALKTKLATKSPKKAMKKSVKKSSAK